jgi:signal peptidase II
MKLYSKSTWLLITATLIGLDQASKLAMLNWLPNLVTFNTGSAFSSPIPRSLVISLSFLIIGGILWYQLKKTKQIEANKTDFWLSLLILAGAVGNLIDRIRLAKVIDFIDLKVWPVFNFADIYLSLAAVLIIWFYLLKGEKKK